VFPHVALVAPPAAILGETSSNFVIVAADRPIDVDTLQQRLGAYTTEAATAMAEHQVADFTADAPVLTDDHAPVDQLLVTP
jgi:hypothetical protein